MLKYLYIDPRDTAAASTLVLELDLKPEALTCGAVDGRASSSSKELSLAFAAKLSSVRYKTIFLIFCTTFFLLLLSGVCSQAFVR